MRYSAHAQQPKANCFSLGASWLIAIVALYDLLGFSNSTSGNYLFAASLLILGMPHGMVDAVYLLQQKTEDCQSRQKSLTHYLVLFTLSGTWAWLSPATSFYFFLLLTAFHWGTTDQLIRPQSSLLTCLLGFSRGLSLISCLIFSHYSEANSILSSYHVEFTPQPWGWIAVSSFLIYFVGLFKIQSSISKKLLSLMDLSIALSMVAYCPALVGLSLYYMCFHAPRSIAWHFTFEETKFLGVNGLVWKPHAYSSLAFFLLLSINLISTHQASWLHFPLLQAHVHLQILMAFTLPHAILMQRFWH